MLKTKRCERCKSLATDPGDSADMAAECSSELEMPIQVDENEGWTRAERGEFMGGGKFFLFLLATMLVGQPPAAPSELPAQFYTPAW